MTPVLQAQEDWLYDIPVNDISVSIGTVGDNGTSIRFSGEFESIQHSQLTIQLSSYMSNIDSDNVDSDAADGTRSYIFGWRSDPLQTHGVGIFIEHSEQDIGLTTTDLAGYYSLQKKEVAAQIKVLAGTVTLNAEQLSLRESSDFQIVEQDVERLGIGATLGYYDKQWGISLTANIYEYNDNGIEEETNISDTISREFNSDLSIILRRIYQEIFNRFIEEGLDREEARSMTNAFFRENEAQLLRRAQNIESSSRVQLINDLNQNIIDNYKSLLSNFDIGVELSLSNEQFIYYLGSQIYESYVSEIRSSILYAGINFQSQSNYRLGVFGSYENESSDSYVELSIGYAW